MLERQLPVTGYLDRFSHRPGQTFSAYISMKTPGPCRIRLVRVISGDPNPAGPGLQFEDMSSVLDTTITGRNQPISLGSSAVVEQVPAGDAAASRTWTLLVCPGITDIDQVVLAERSGTDEVVLRFGPSGASAEIAGQTTTTRVAVAASIRKLRWYRLWLSIKPTGEIVLGQIPVGGTVAAIAEGKCQGMPVAGGALTIAARDPAAPTEHFTGRIQDPSIRQGFAAGVGDLDHLRVLAEWDFSLAMSTQTIRDVGTQACHGQLLNLPTRAMTGATWSGEEMCWRHAPRDYAAIHFHADDLGDCGWASDFSWTVPDTVPSGSYALHLSCADGEDWIPLYIVPPRTGPFAKIAFLASTFTYQAYADHARGAADDAYMARVRDWGAYPYNPDHYPIYGRSTYNVHLDGSGISFSSRRRPILTMRPGYLTFNDPLGSGLRHYPADTHILAWLEAKGFAFDVITDEDLDDEGVDLLRPYQLIMTGSHPEYHTPGTLDALLAYTTGGGRMAYLGGNGFYWRVARDKDMPWATELRRAEGGIRTWAAEPGEYYHQLDGAYGGLWRRNRRPPQVIAGVGFSGQGGFEGTYYRRLPASQEPRFAWMFEGVDGDILGDYGLSGGGAAGFELDRADDDLGTPDGAVILARSEDPPKSFFTVPEEVLAGRRTVTGERLEDLMRAEIVWFPTEGGGEVFSVGSITFCGSLWQNKGFGGPISKLLENVVKHFIR
jgi:N,N-dimethylformamidase